MELINKNILVTGSAGFIGSNLILRLLKESNQMTIVGFDNLNDYYDVSLKEWRLREIEKESKKHPEINYVFIKGDLTDAKLLSKVFEKYKFDIVVHLAAQAGVRYSISHPDEYVQSNVVGFYNILENIRKAYDVYGKKVLHFVYASSSSVYGSRNDAPYSVNDNTDCPVSFYAATKKTNEIFAYAYSHMYNIPSTGLRFFTVYGPGGRPDMAYFSFADKLRSNQKIQLFNYGECQRDFTYIDDVTESIVRIMKKRPKKMPGKNLSFGPPYIIYNIGNSKPETLRDFVNILEQKLIEVGVLGKDNNFIKNEELVPMQLGDVSITSANIGDLEKDIGFKPSTPLEEGLYRFAKWYKEYYQL